MQLRQAIRRARARPAVAVVVIFSLAFGLGITAAMAGVSDALLFRSPAHVADPSNVVRLAFAIDDPSGRAMVSRFHYPSLSDLRGSSAFRSVAAYAQTSVSVTRGSDTLLAS